jgi:hypothetical protein
MERPRARLILHPLHFNEGKQMEDLWLRFVLLLPRFLRVRILARRGRQPNAEELAWAKQKARELGLF